MEPRARDTAPHSGFPRWAVIVLFGPFVGAFTFFLAVLLLDPPPATFDDMLAVFGLVMLFGWVAGLLPALLAAIAWHFVPRQRMGFAARLAASLAIGAVTGVVGALPVINLVMDASSPPPEGLALICLSGAVALAVTALPGKRR